MKWYHYLAIVILLSGGAVVYQKSRGIRNNNPGNIRRTSDKWQGLKASQTDKDFFQFQTAVFGIRAMAKTLQNYQTIHGLTSIQGIISRWAPSNENDTQAYIDSVAQRMRVFSDTRLNLTQNKGELHDLIKAMIRQENGINPYSDETITEAINLV